MSQTNSLLWSTLLLTVVGVGALLIFTAAWAYRKRVRREDAAGPPFTIQDLRDMRDRGAVTELEYETMRAALLEKNRRIDADRASRSDSAASNRDRSDDCAAEDNNL